MDVFQNSYAWRLRYTRKLANLIMVSLLTLIPGFAAAGSTAPAGPVILELSGKLDTANDAGVRFDRAMLEALPQTVIRTETPWTEGVVEFEGPLLRTVLDFVGAQGATLDAVALNDYSVEIPVQDAVDYPVILALKMNGSALRVRTKGPLWVIYPWDDFQTLQSESYYARAIWQLSRIIVR